MKHRFSLPLILILVTATILRFYNLMHDSPYFFNPDERNMANAISQLRLPANLSEIPICLISQISPVQTDNRKLKTENCNLNPHFFSYGQFPLYLAFASDQISKIPISLIRQISQIQPTTYNPSTPLGASPQLSTSFSSAIFWLRFWSALSSTLTVLLVYLITKELLIFTVYNQRFSRIYWRINADIPRKSAILSALIATFSPGLIQSAHFGTTESLLTFFFLASIYLSLSYLGNPSTPLGAGLGHLKFVLLTSLIIGLSLGSKLTGIFFFIPPAISLMVQIIKLFTQKIAKRKKIIGLLGYWVIGLLILISSISIFILSSPYNLVEPENFKSAVFGYEQDVATGKYEAFYTRQFVNTTPILFQIEKIFPYALGWPVFILGTLGFLLINFQFLIFNLKSIFNYLIFKNFKFKNSLKISNLKFQILTISLLIYLIPNSFLFAKWTRFMTPILPFFSIFSVFAIYVMCSVFNLNRSKFSIFNSQFPLNFQTLKIKNLDFISNFKFQISNYCVGLLVFISLLPGIMFMNIYRNEDTRVTASKWIYKNIPNNSYILSETANVVDIPLGLPTMNDELRTKNYQTISFDFYHLDENPLLFNQLIQHLEKANYIFIPSRRIFKNYTRLPQKYPLVTKYYQLLFSGRLGFEKVIEISSFPQLQISQIGPIRLIFNDEDAEETFTVFDHPVIRIYRKIKPMKAEEYKSLFIQ